MEAYTIVTLSSCLLSLGNMYFHFFHVFLWHDNSFLFGTKNISLSKYTSLFIHSSTEGHLGYFHIWANMNKIDINMHVQVDINFQFTGSYDKSMFSFVRNCQTVFQSGCTILHSPTAMNVSFCCSKTLPIFGIVSALDFDCAN